MVVDRSGSNRIGERAAQTEAARAAVAKSTCGDGQCGSAHSSTAPRDRSRQPRHRAFRRVAQRAGGHAARSASAALSSSPTGSSTMLPANADALGFHAPLHALITGHEGERDRRLELVEAPRYGIVGKDQTIGLRVLDSADKGEPADRHAEARRPDARQPTTPGSASGSTSPRHIDHAGDNIFELEVATLPGELTALNNKAVVTVERRARQAARAAGLRRAAPRRAHVAQPAEIRRQRRSRPFHHPAPAGQEHRRHADQRTER